MVRRRLALVILLATALHVVGIARNSLPAQDGLKFIKVARAFHDQPWDLVVRGSDQHPLYPALIASIEPAVAAFLGPGPEGWRVSAQAVSAAASVLILLPICGLGRELFGRRVGLIAALAWVLLPLSATVGRDTLSDPVALLFAALGLRLGARALREPSWRAAVGCGLAGGFGFLARPEVALVPVAVMATAGLRSLLDWARGIASMTTAEILPRTVRFAALGVAFLSLVGSYATIKGELSEKLALRQAVAIRSPRDQPRRSGHWMPPGLDDPRLSFAPKEESDAPGRMSLAGSACAVAGGWAEGLGWAPVPFVLLGLLRAGPARGPGRALLGVYALGFAVVLVRHGMMLGYVSGRHTLMLVLVSLPWAAAGLLAVGERAAGRLRFEATGRRIGLVLTTVMAIALGTAVQLRPSHPSRWGHRAAGHWLADHAEPGDAVLDTRGWAAFVSGLRAYDPWHIGQALSDSRLAFVVIGRDELESTSRRAATLRALLGRAGERVAAFPAREGGPDGDVQVYRYQRPDTWEGLEP